MDNIRGEVTLAAPKVGLQNFKYSGIFDIKVDQPTVFESVGVDLLTDFMNGFNATLLAYGQTGN